MHAHRTFVEAVASDAKICRVRRRAENKSMYGCVCPGQISILEKLNNRTKTKCGFSTIKLFNALNDIHCWRELRRTHTLHTTYVHAAKAHTHTSPVAHTINHCVDVVSCEADEQMLRHGINVEFAVYTEKAKCFRWKFLIDAWRRRWRRLKSTRQR